MSLNISNIFKRTPKVVKEHQFIFIEAPIEAVSPQAVRWGEGEWWPKESVLYCLRKVPGDLQLGAQYKIKMLIPLAKDLEMEISKFSPSREIEWTYTKGILQGKQWLLMEGRYNGTRVEFILEYQIKGFLNRVAWRFLFKQKFLDAVKLSLQALQKHVMAQHTRFE